MVLWNAVYILVAAVGLKIFMLSFTGYSLPKKDSGFVTQQFQPVREKFRCFLRGYRTRAKLSSNLAIYAHQSSVGNLGHKLRVRVLRHLG